MVWRLGGLLVTTGMVLDLTLSGAFVVIGFASMFCGVITLALYLEGSLLGERLEGHPMADAEEQAHGAAA